MAENIANETYIVIIIAEKYLFDASKTFQLIHLEYSEMLLVFEK